MRSPRASAIQVVVHITALLPLSVIIWDFWQGQLTVNPIQEIQLRTGRYALLILILSLSCTPLSRIFGSGRIFRLRRPLGLYAFAYASLHFLNFIGLDYGFNLALLREDIAEKSFVILGFAAFLCMLPVAITSTRGWMQRLGKNWERVHWLVYPAAILAVTHFTLQVKADFRLPLLYWALLILLLATRLPVIRKMAGRFAPGRSGSGSGQI
ncbi:MAG: protein-methionine-sulfoxide reductase heme-binding subunit MsrQ [Dehalococcoidales bacterium]|nr:protein-methionine-sulfoxide reductase heme-binding subunit MsrQ [Dehalococcoidales bacterium]